MPDPAAPPVTSADSPDSLPPSRYSIDQLANYIKRQLGFPVWTVELTQQQIVDAINDALGMISIWRPASIPLPLTISRSRNRYLDEADAITTNPLFQGVTDVEFVEPLPAPTAMYYGNLLTQTPLFKNGLDDYDAFLRWRTTWMRVTSVQPDWHYEESIPALFIHNPIERYHTCVWYMLGYGNTKNLRPGFDCDWVKKYALAKAKMIYGEILAKYSGALPGPMQNMQLDQQKRDRAQQDIDKLEEKLQAAQLSAPLSIG